MRVQIACCSNVGKVRKHNEDYIVGDESLRLVVLADGMGGYQAGEIASKIAADTVYQEMSAQLRKQSFLEPRDWQRLSPRHDFTGTSHSQSQCCRL